MIDAFNSEKESNNVEKLFNFHIDIHFNRLMSEYEVLWNVNVLFDENKHRFFKQIVLFINYRKSKRQLLFKKIVKFIVKILIFNAFDHVENSRFNFDACMYNVQLCLKNLLFFMHDDDDTYDDNSDRSFELLKSMFHVQLSIR